MNDYTLEFVGGTIIVQGLAWATGANTNLGLTTAIGGSIAALFLSALDNVNSQISSGFAGMLFLTVCYQSLPTMLGKIGLTQNGIAKTKATTVAPAAYSIDLTDPAGANAAAGVATGNTAPATPSNGTAAKGQTGLATPQKSGGLLNT